MTGRIAGWAFKYLSGNPAEYCVPPGSEVELEFGEMDGDRPMFIATTYNNHGFELWLGYTHGGWQTHLWTKDARRLAWFILWNWWAVATWFGLKRKIWYWALKKYTA